MFNCGPGPTFHPQLSGSSVAAQWGPGTRPDLTRPATLTGGWWQDGGGLTCRQEILHIDLPAGDLNAALTPEQLSNCGVVRADELQSVLLLTSYHQHT